MLVGGGPQQKVLALRKEPEIDVMQAVPMQQVVCENIYRAVSSGTVRTSVQPACFAGSGSGAGTGTASPAIKRPCGVNPRRGEGMRLSYYGYLKHTNSRKIEKKWKVKPILKKCKGVIRRNERKIFTTAAAG